jgi:hypothetical protein
MDWHSLISTVFCSNCLVKHAVFVSMIVVSFVFSAIAVYISKVLCSSCALKFLDLVSLNKICHPKPMSKSKVHASRHCDIDIIKMNDKLEEYNKSNQNLVSSMQMFPVNCEQFCLQLVLLHQYHQVCQAPTAHTTCLQQPSDKTLLQIGTAC